MHNPLIKPSLHLVFHFLPSLHLVFHFLKLVAVSYNTIHTLYLSLSPLPSHLCMCFLQVFQAKERAISFDYTIDLHGFSCVENMVLIIQFEHHEGALGTPY